MAPRWARLLRPVRPVAPRPASQDPGEGEAEELETPPVQARVTSEPILAAGAALDALAAVAFSGPAGRARVEPLLARFDREIGGLSEDDPDFELLQVTRMDWALCEVEAEPDASPGDTWAWRVVTGRLGEGGPRPAELSPLRRLAASALTGLFEVYPGKPTWVRDRVRGVVARLLEGVGPWPEAERGRPAALWELRLVADPAGGFHLARPPIDYPLELLEALDEQLPRRFAPTRWPTMQDLRRARLRYLRAGERTPIARMLEWS